VLVARAAPRLSASTSSGTFFRGIFSLRFRIRLGQPVRKRGIAPAERCLWGRLLKGRYGNPRWALPCGWRRWPRRRPQRGRAAQGASGSGCAGPRQASVLGDHDGRTLIGAVRSRSRLRPMVGRPVRRMMRSGTRSPKGRQSTRQAA